MSDLTLFAARVGLPHAAAVSVAKASTGTLSTLVATGSTSGAPGQHTPGGVTRLAGSDFQY